MSSDESVIVKKLLYQSKNRGCKETDLILGKFADHMIASMGQYELQEYAVILSQTDSDIVDWITGKEVVPNHLQSSIMDKLLSFSRCQFLNLD